MRKFLTFSVLATSILAPLTASADDFYAGVALAGGGKVNFTNPANGKTASDNTKPLVRLYGGWSFADALALEGGVMQSGEGRFDKTALRLAEDPTFKIRTVYLAARLTHRISDDWSVFGKVGMARNRFSGSDGTGGHDSLSNTKPLLGLGVAYNISKAVALTVDYEHVGATNKPGLHIKQSGLQFGLNVSF